MWYFTQKNIQSMDPLVAAVGIEYCRNNKIDLNEFYLKEMKNTKTTAVECGTLLEKLVALNIFLVFWRPPLSTEKVSVTDFFKILEITPTNKFDYSQVYPGSPHLFIDWKVATLEEDKFKNLSETSNYILSPVSHAKPDIVLNHFIISSKYSEEDGRQIRSEESKLANLTVDPTKCYYETKNKQYIPNNSTDLKNLGIEISKKFATMQPLIRVRVEYPNPALHSRYGPNGKDYFEDLGHGNCTVIITHKELKILIVGIDDIYKCRLIDLDRMSKETAEELY